MKYLRLIMVLLVTLQLSWASSLKAQVRERITVAIMIFDDVQIIDFTGPWETFGQAGYKIFTVSEKKDTITTNMNMKIFPDYTLTDSPDADILVIPGGGLPHDLDETDPKAEWLIRKEPSAKYVLTVCNGAFILGATDLCKGKSITTNAGMINHIEQFVSGSKAVYDKRFVHDGKIITAGGLTAGIDASLYIISVIDSEGRAQEVANKMEYNWDPDGKYVRTGLADFELSMALDFNPPLRKKVLEYKGDENYWILEFLVKREDTLEEFAGQLEDAASSYKWNLVNEKKENEAKSYEWTYTNKRNENWRLKADFTTTEEDSIFRLKIHIEKN